MGKVFLLTAFVMSFAFGVNASNVVIINDECVMLEDIFPGIGIKDEIFCGLDYGDTKIVNRQMSLYIINKHNIEGARPGEVTFKRRGTLLTDEQFREDISNLLSVMYSGLEVEVGTIRMGRPFYYSVEKGYDIDIPKERFGNVSVKVDNGIRKFNYTVNLKAFREIYVATGSIRKDQEIEGLVRLERYDLSKVRGEPVSRIKGVIARRSISSGRPVTAGDVMVKPDAFKGSSVQIVYSSGGLNVSADGELMEDAHTGKNVRVKNAASGKIIRGTYQNGRKVFVNTR